MALDLLMTTGGIAIVLLGGYLLVASAVTVALGFGLSRAVVGATVVAFGTSAPELTVGFISTDARCGATPLYRLLNAGPDAHFYTVSAPERDNAVSNLGFVDQGIAGYVWLGA